MVTYTYNEWNSSTYPIWKLQDINHVIGHGLRKTASYILAKNGAYYEATIGTTGKLVYGGSANAGAINGTSPVAVLQAAINNGGNIFVKNSFDAFDITIDPRSNANVVFEAGGTVTWTGAVSDVVFENATDDPLEHFSLKGLNLDINSVADVEPIVLNTPQNCRFKNLKISNTDDKVALKILATAAAGQNAWGNRFEDILMEDVFSMMYLEGTTGTWEVITANVFDNIIGLDVTGAAAAGIELQGAVDTNFFTNIGVSLSLAGQKGIIWNNTGTPAANVGNYNNNFDMVWVNAFGAANHATTTLLIINNSKQNVIRNFYCSPPNDGTFLGTVLTDTNAVSYLLESNEGEDDLVPVVYTKEYNYGDFICQNIDARDQYITVNGSYTAQDSHFYIQTKVGAVNKQADLAMYTATGDVALGIPYSFIVKLGDNAAAEGLVIQDSDAAEVAKINSDGAMNALLAYYVAGTKVIGTQAAAISDAAGGGVVDAEARAALNDLLAKLRTHGLIAT